MLERIFPSIVLNRERTKLAIAEAIAAREAADAMTRIVLESVPVFAQDNDEREWSASTTGREPLNYSGSDLDRMLATALNLSFRPGGRGLLDVMESFVIGESMRVISEDENPEVQEYWDDWAKVNNWDMKSKEAFRRFLRDGEVFLRWFKPVPGQRDDKKYGHLRVRFMEPNEIKDPAGSNNWGHHTFGIETDPDDIETVLNYYRNYGYTAKGELAATDKWEQIPAAEIDHFKCMVDSNVKRGRSWLLGVGEYIVKHEQWLDQRFQLNRMRNLFAVIGNVKGVGTSDIATVKGKFADTTGKTNAGEGTPKKMPSNALMLLQKGIEWDLKSLNINASDAAEDGRNFQLAICTGTQLAEYVVRGDASNSNMASTMISESPMVRMFQKYQDMWRYMQGVIYARVIRYGIDTVQIPAMSTKTTEGQLRSTRRATRIATNTGRSYLAESIRERRQIDLQFFEADDPDDTVGKDDGGKDKSTKDDLKRKADKKDKPVKEPKVEEVPTSLECQIEFPPLVSRDPLQESQALAIHQDRKWASRQTCAAKMGYDPQKEKAEMEKDDQDERSSAKDDDMSKWGM
jgi:hypothetical protein